ncbi:MAG: hypothetical protein JNK67_05695 [Alphaproteobacteria bacterium]|nr:hypothetical protein [Alphaproteobacteria bacterium]
MTGTRIGWRDNGDSLDVALVANRALARGRRVWWQEDGDYVVERLPPLDGLRTVPDAAPAAGSVELTPAATALFTGPATGYPYWGYYALCLLRLGLTYAPVDGAAIAGGGLARANLFVIPGGFATWNFDRAEDAPGADAQVRAFLAGGGRAIGSCGGAYYLSAGRPGWSGTADAMPLYTHEYLQSGVGIVSIDIAAPMLGRGLPPSLDLPYYHGPIWDRVGSNSAIAATFAALTLPGRLGIDNPLDHARFVRDMRGKPAVLDAGGLRGEAILFSPHPEMGDLLRKYIALDGYARKYLPIRGLPVLRDTMRFYAPADSPSFRLVANAAHDLTSRPGTRRVPPPPVEATGGPADAIVPTLRRVLRTVDPRDDADLAPLIGEIVGDLAARLDRAPPATGPLAGHIAQAIAGRETALHGTPIAQRLMEVELGIALVDCLARIDAVDRTLEAA